MDAVRRAAIVFAAAILVLTAFACTDSDGAPLSPDMKLAEEHPDADAIIYEGAKSTVNIMKRTASFSDIESKEEWTVASVTIGSSLVVSQLSCLVGDLNVVMVSGALGELSLIRVDEKDDQRSPVDVVFEMSGGSLGTMKVLTIAQSVKNQLKDHYTIMYKPLGAVSLSFASCSVTEVSPTEDMVEADSIRTVVSTGAEVDRMLPSGKNGRYGSVEFVLDGGSVGYMTNVRAVVGSLDYKMRSGSVDYFCIGADTEFGNNYVLSSINSFYARGAVTVSIDSTVEFISVIIGSGVVEIPRLLWNGDEVSMSTIETSAKNILIDAPGTEVWQDKCFRTSNRSQSTCYQLSSYTIGGNARTKSLSTTCYVSGTGAVKVYGDRGIWASASDLEIRTGYHLMTSCILSVPAGTQLHISEGASLTVACQCYLEGSLLNDGTLMNTGLIEKSRGGSVEGSIDGDGFVAYSISVNPREDGSIEVMASEDDSVVIRTSGSSYIRSISVLLCNGDRHVSIVAPSSMYFSGDRFLVSLKDVSASENGSSYRLAVQGIDGSVLSALTMTVSVTIAGNTEHHVYAEDGREMKVLESLYPELVFIADGNGTYTIDEKKGGDGEASISRSAMLNYMLAAAIVAVGAITIVVILRKD